MKKKLLLLTNFIHVWVTVKFTHIRKYQKIPTHYSINGYSIIKICFLQFLPKWPENGPLQLSSQILIILSHLTH